MSGTTHAAPIKPFWAWSGAGLCAGLAIAAIAADHFALTRGVDQAVMLWINRVASQRGVVNHAIWSGSEMPLLTGALQVALIWYLWFTRPGAADRASLMLGFGGVISVAVLSRVLQISLPQRLRPLHDPESLFQPLAGIDASLLNRDWASFPSDHAVLYFALVGLLWQRSAWVGLLALLSALFNVLPRVYLGLHYLSDILGGALVGIGFILMFERFGPRRGAGRLLAWEARRPGLFYAAAFLASYEVATLFADIREAARGVPSVLRSLAGLS